MPHRTNGIELEYLQKEITDLHNQGMTSAAIGRKLFKDHSTILYHLRKLGLKAESVGGRPVGKYPICILKGYETKLPNVETNFTKEIIHETHKTYQDFLNDEKDRRFKYLTSKR